MAGKFLPDTEISQDKFQALVFKASMFMYEGDAKQAYQVWPEKHLG